jgi:dienelactone hydrolase
MRFSEPEVAITGLRRVGVVPIDESPLEVASDAGPIKARMYTPRGVARPPGIVIVHGVHHLGIDEPRLVRFARTIAASGITVLTPEVRELADYRVDARSIATIGAATRELRHRVEKRVGLMGLSFAGGLSLLAAANASFAPDIDFVLAVGAHDDLARVLRFFATDAAPRPDGRVLSMHAHGYGPLVLVYSHIEDFFPPEDVPVAREALRTWLWEERDEARAVASKLAAPSRALMEQLFDHHLDGIVPELLREVDRNQALMSAVSPHDHVGGIGCPVFLLHGASDNVIPPSETLWLAHDLPAGTVRRMLVSSAIGHVELDAAPSLADQWAVVDFMARVLEEADRSR